MPTNPCNLKLINPGRNIYKSEKISSGVNLIESEGKSLNELRVKSRYLYGHFAPWLDCSKSVHSIVHTYTCGLSLVFLFAVTPNLARSKFVWNKLTWSNLTAERKEHKLLGSTGLLEAS